MKLYLYEILHIIKLYLYEILHLIKIYLTFVNLFVTHETLRQQTQRVSAVRE